MRFPSTERCQVTAIAVRAILFLIVVAGTSGQGQPSKVDESAAVDRAIAFLGMEPSKSSFQGPDRVSVDTARLQRRVAFDQVPDTVVPTWLVEFDSLTAGSNAGCPSGSFPKGDFRVLVDPSSGGLLEVSSRTDEFDLAATAVDWRKADHGQVLPKKGQSLVTELPEISLFEAVTALDCPDLCKAHEMIAYLVDLAFDPDSPPVAWNPEGDHKRVWWLTVRSCDIVKTDSSVQVSNARIHYIVVDAITGNVLYDVTSYLDHPFSLHRH